MINDQLVADLQARDLWDDELVDQLKYHDGSLQEIDRVPDELKELYRGAFEIDPRHQLRLTAHRQTWIDQSVSHNVFFPSTDGSMLDDIYRTAWRLGLKTTYYLRTLGASQIEKSTLDMDEYGKTQHRDGGTGGNADATARSASGDAGGDADSSAASSRDADASSGSTESRSSASDSGSTPPSDNDSTAASGDGSASSDDELCAVEDPTCDACQ